MLFAPRIWFLVKLSIIRRISVQNEDGTKTEYRVWNPFRSKLAAAILGGVDNVRIELESFTLELLQELLFPMLLALVGWLML